MSLHTPTTSTATSTATSTDRPAPRGADALPVLVVVLVVLVAALGAGAWIWEQRAARSVDARVAEQAGALLPGGRIEHADVTDTPALLAALRGHVQQAVLDGRSADGHQVLLVVREYDLADRRARSVSWDIGGLPFAPGWQHERDDSGASHDREVRQVDGHRVVVSAHVQLEGSSVVVSPGTLTIDGAPVRLQDAPQEVRASLAPVRVAVPLPDASSTVHRMWFDDHGIGVELRADHVRVGEAVRG